MLSDLEVFATPSLGDNSYLAAVGRDAVLIDPQRDVWRFLAAAEDRGLTVRYVLETHVHNDYVSGALEVRAATGAKLVAPAGGHYTFPYRAMAEGDEIRLPGLTLRAMETPGHTPEHVAYLVFEDDAPDPVAVFTGGSLILGSAGRTDLAGDERAEELTRAQFHSIRRLSALGDDTLVLPTHGAGSFCAASAPTEERTSTVGEQREQNPALLVKDEDVFVRQQLSGLLAFPAYYRHMGGINRSGPAVLGRLPVVHPLSAEDLVGKVDAGASIVDARDRLAFAAAHLPGSINVELDDDFATYVGWVVPFGAPLVLVLPEPFDAAAQEAITQLIRVGYERVEGYLAGGIEAWRAEGRHLDDYAAGDLDELERRSTGDGRVRVLDVRQPREWDAGRIPGSLQVFIGDLPRRLGQIPRDREVWTICASGRRASVAASLLDRAGIRVGLVAREGVPAWLARNVVTGRT